VNTCCSIARVCVSFTCQKGPSYTSFQDVRMKSMFISVSVLINSPTVGALLIFPKRVSESTRSMNEGCRRWDH
jgi:hypothetical protein